MDKDLAVLEWLKGCPQLISARREDGHLFLNFLSENNGRWAVIPVAADDSQVYVNGDAVRNYDFQLQVTLPYSHSADSLNLECISLLRRVSDWIAQADRGGVYPDFGGCCSEYKVRNLANAPKIIRAGNSSAVYSISARIKFTEKKEINI